MALIRIDDPTDERLAIYRDLPKSNLTRQSGLFIAEGKLLVDRLAASNYPLHSVLIDTRRQSLLPPMSSDVPIYVAPAGVLEQIIGFNFHRGILACGRRRERLPLNAALSDLPAAATVVVCVELHDPTNLGGVLRNCAAFGVDAVLLTPRCADPFSRRVLRVSMGQVLQLRLIEAIDLVGDLAHLRRSFQFELVATVLSGTAELLAVARRGPRLALLMGNEAHGLPPELVATCDRQLTIPMSDGIDSLNVAVASGIVLYHFTRLQRG